MKAAGRHGMLFLILLVLFSDIVIRPTKANFYIYETNPNRLRTLFKYNKATKQTPTVHCINIGHTVANKRNTSPFLPESKYVAYRLWEEHRIVEYNETIEATRFQSVFQVQRLAPYDLSFLVRVNTDYPYTFAFGFAQVEVCEKNNRVLNISAGGNYYPTKVDSIRLVGCNRAHFLRITEVRPDENGFVEVIIRSQIGIAALAALCITRTGL